MGKILGSLVLLVRRLAPHHVDTAKVEHDILMPEFILFCDDIVECPDFFASMLPFDIWFAENFQDFFFFPVHESGFKLNDGIDMFFVLNFFRFFVRPNRGREQGGNKKIVIFTECTGKFLINISGLLNPHNHYREGWDGCLPCRSFFPGFEASVGAGFAGRR